jgi:hypothetical protein
MDLITDYMYQALMNQPTSFHCVSYELNNHIVNVRFFVIG